MCSNIAQNCHLGYYFGGKTKGTRKYFWEIPPCPPVVLPPLGFEKNGSYLRYGYDTLQTIYIMIGGMICFTFNKMSTQNTHVVENNYTYRLGVQWYCDVHYVLLVVIFENLIDVNTFVILLYYFTLETKFPQDPISIHTSDLDHWYSTNCTSLYHL